MKQSIFNTYKDEILSFADDMDDACVVPQTGEKQFCRNEEILTCYLREKGPGNVIVEYEKKEYPYKSFLAEVMGKLDILAKKITTRDKEEEIYVDTAANLLSGSQSKEGRALELLRAECINESVYTTKICFVTADAGHGKTMLLKTLERKMASDYLLKKTPFLFWHIDLHGRDLVRLNEAIMYDLGELRMSGLYYNSILTLIRNGLIVLAIDGFDELAAETGGDVALGSLTSLISQLDGQGTVIAASRRTFFNTQEYIQRTKILAKFVKGCDFDELRLKNWGEKECVEYMSYTYSLNDSREDYQRIIHILSAQDTQREGSHPLLERPFLFTKIVKYANENNEYPSDFITAGGIIDDNIGGVIKAFVKREVTKWKDRDKDTGKPYLTYEQHFELLAEIAKEMWEEQKNYLSLETIEFILAILCDKWNIEDTLRPIISRFVQSHAMLLIAPEGDKYRTFDHEEFKNYFFAYSLVKTIEESSSPSLFLNLKNMFTKAQLPDSVAMYMVNDIEAEKRKALVIGLLKEVGKEWKQTYFQLNLGTMIPFMLDGMDNDDQEFVIQTKVTFTSIAFENKTLSNICFKGCNFINVSFNNTELKNITFDECEFSNLKFCIKSKNVFDHVIITENCRIAKVTVNESIDGASEYMEYSPNNIKLLIQKQGIIYGVMQTEPECKNNRYRKMVKRFLNRYNSYYIQYEINIKEERINNADIYKYLLSDVVPLLEKYNIIHKVENNQTRQSNSKAWALDVDLAELFKAEEDKSSKFYPFWNEVNQHE